MNNIIKKYLIPFITVFILISCDDADQKEAEDAANKINVEDHPMQYVVKGFVNDIENNWYFKDATISEGKNHQNFTKTSLAPIQEMSLGPGNNIVYYNNNILNMDRTIDNATGGSSVYINDKQYNVTWGVEAKLRFEDDGLDEDFLKNPENYYFELIIKISSSEIDQYYQEFNGLEENPFIDEIDKQVGEYRYVIHSLAGFLILYDDYFGPTYDGEEDTDNLDGLYIEYHN